MGWPAGDMTDWERCLKLNMLAPMALTHAFSPGMVKRKVSQLCDQTESKTKSCQVLLNPQYDLISDCFCDGQMLQFALISLWFEL